MPLLPSLRSLRSEIAEGMPTSTQKPLHIMTITKGGLGNILFQWLATESYARENTARKADPQISYLSGTMDKRPDITSYVMFHNVATFEKMDIPSNSDEYKESSFSYKSIPNTHKNVLVLDGYFQSWKYCEPHRRQLVRQLRTCGGEPLEQSTQFLNKIRAENTGKRLVGVHIRQGDYLSTEHIDTHYICNPSYWERALRTALAAGVVKDPDHDIFVIASDDPAAVAKMHAFKGLQAVGYKIIYIPFNETTACAEKTFWTLAGVDTLFISNSSYSLGAYMCRDRETQLIAPAEWFGSKGPAFKINDIVPQETLLVR